MVTIKSNPSLQRLSNRATPQAVDDRHEIIKILGQGASADVFLARHKALNELRVLKIMHQSLLIDAKKRAKFRMEAQLAANLKHPAIVQIYDVVETSSRLQIEMEYIKGQSLRQHIETAGHFPPSVALALIMGILEGLEHAHNARLVFDGVEFEGVIHRDLKPENILIRENGQPVVCDFGVAKLGAELMTQTQHISGSVAYMAPERLRGEPSTRSIDVFAVGIIFFELLKGCRPFPGGNSTQVIENILKWNIRDIDTDLADMDSSLVRVIKKSVAQKAKDRYQNATEMREALKPLYKLYHGDAETSTVIKKFSERGQLSTAEFKALLPDESGLHPKIWIFTIVSVVLLGALLYGYFQQKGLPTKQYSAEPFQHIQELVQDDKLENARTIIPELDSTRRQQALYLIASAYERTRKDPGTALLLANQAMDFSAHPLVLLLRAELYLKQGMFNLAEEDLNRFEGQLNRLNSDLRAKYYWLSAQLNLEKRAKGRSLGEEPQVAAKEALQNYLSLAPQGQVEAAQIERAKSLLSQLR